ncbi:hypothetical protein EN850_02925 [Mesorhizobium sp. M8A.F.Ca.ET.207.01.1.1]|uniref:hypothetical protein n=1 Tax=Mesorhizobium sp. M8A.F.Ca.ET.207.01.1.1 TaxID=2563968 RepID=UPI00109C4947|nr:hypothetical protein [Mesorhizobium sp. M8A.F.Ca.ET.207.01.1.1]TGQ83712.1 hypothetical protein EN850_02925 [Mesorhizobium sp. M8A.F.Ca.ET.207.01.1.1]
MTDWQLVLLTAVATTIGTVLVTYVGHRMTVAKDTQEERDRHGTYVATRVVCMLDPFVLQCVDVVNDQGLYVDDELTPQVDAPSISFPDDLDWRTVDAALMYRILTLPNEIAAADSTIVAYAEHSGPPNWDEVWDERRFQYGHVGLYALDLAADLRRRYGLEPKDYSRWDPRGVLDAAYTVEDVRRKNADTSIKKMVANSLKKKKAAKVEKAT